MSREIKKLMVSEFISDYKDSNNLVVVNFKGVNAHQANEMRRSFGGSDIKLKVIKNSLANIAFNEIGISAFEKIPDGPSAIATCDGDPIALAKLLVEWSKKVTDLKIIGGLMDGKAITKEEIKSLALIPSKQVLLTQILMGINTPLVQLANSFNAVIQGLCIVLSAIKEKKETNT